MCSDARSNHTLEACFYHSVSCRSTRVRSNKFKTKCIYYFEFIGMNIRAEMVINRHLNTSQNKVKFLSPLGALGRSQAPGEHKSSFHEILERQCKKNGVEYNDADIETLKKNIGDCVTGLFVFETFFKQAQKARAKGLLEETIKLYCKEPPQLNCKSDNGRAPCLDVLELRQEFGLTADAPLHSFNIVCANNGEMIRLFIESGAIECYQEKRNFEVHCPDKVQVIASNMDSSKKTSLNEQCKNFDELSGCLLKIFKGCSSPTPFITTQNYYQSLRDSSPCREVTSEN